jgi:hypothetical protein
VIAPVALLDDPAAQLRVGERWSRSEPADDYTADSLLAFAFASAGA